MKRWGDYGNRLSAKDHEEIRRRIARGETFATAAAAVGCSRKSIQRLMAGSAGMPLPPVRPRSPLRLSIAEREEISRGLLAGESMRVIAAKLRRAPSTISREVGWSGGRHKYRGCSAEVSSAMRAKRPKCLKLDGTPRLFAEVERRLVQRWSPQQISARLVADFPDDEEMRVSHETIYKSLFVQARGALRKELTTYLRTGRTRRRGHKRSELSGGGRLANMVMIAERPAEVSDRAIPGHWEGDLILGKGGKSAIGTLVERTSRYVVLLHLPDGRSADEVRKALTRQVAKLPAEFRRTLTWDQGKEMAQHVRFSVDTAMKVYFCDPHSPWQRGSNENTNGLLRQYFPKGTDLSQYSRADLAAVARELNTRPRQTLGWMKPSEVFGRAVASTA